MSSPAQPDTDVAQISMLLNELNNKVELLEPPSEHREIRYLLDQIIDLVANLQSPSHIHVTMTADRLVERLDAGMERLDSELSNHIDLQVRSLTNHTTREVLDSKNHMESNLLDLAEHTTITVEELALTAAKQLKSYGDASLASLEASIPKVVEEIMERVVGEMVEEMLEKHSATLEGEIVDVLDDLQLGITAIAERQNELIAALTKQE